MRVGSRRRRGDVFTIDEDFDAAVFATAIPPASLAQSAIAKSSSAQSQPGHGPWARPKVVLISLDGAKPDFIREYLRTGVLPWNGGLGSLVRNGTMAVD